MMITVNGEEKNRAGQSLDDLLRDEGFDKDKIAVGLNGQVVPKTQYASLVLNEGDAVEVFHFMGGG